MISLQALIENKQSSLGQLIAKARALEQLNGVLQAVLPEALKNEVYVVHYQHGLLTLGAPSGPMATALRFACGDIQEGLSKRLGSDLPIHQIVVRMLPKGHR